MYFNDRYTLQGTGGRHQASQVFFIEDVFEAYFSVTDLPDRIVELGTDNGSFSSIIYKLMTNHSSQCEPEHKFTFYSFDVKPRPELLPNEVIFQELDIFNNIEYIGGLIKENTLILCDNGRKIEEVWALVPYMKKDCVIMAHDYFKDAPTFYIESNWAVCEIEFNDVRPLLPTYGLELYHPEIMDKGLWLSLIKK
jgi:hypothetical protein